jgi:hypothetical protein
MAMNASTCFGFGFALLQNLLKSFKMLIKKYFTSFLEIISKEIVLVHVPSVFSICEKATIIQNLFQNEMLRFLHKKRKPTSRPARKKERKKKIKKENKKRNPAVRMFKKM